MDTQLAEIKTDDEPPDIDVLRKDTLEFLNFWEKFYPRFQQNENKEIAQLSFDRVICPLEKDEYSSYKELTLYDVSISDFLNSPFKKNFNYRTIPVSKKARFDILIYYVYNKNNKNLINKKDSVLLKYRITLLSEKIRRPNRLLRDYSFSFLKINNSIKFTGLDAGHVSSRLLNDSAARANLYFPLYRKGQDPITNSISLDTFSNLWYSASLSVFNEPHLYNYKGVDDSYRFTWLRSFNNPVVIRFHKQGNDFILSTKEMTDYQGFKPDTMLVNTTQYLTASEWNKWIFKLGRINFWKIETHDPDPISANDGAMWTLEANVKGKYHFITRQFPDAHYKECCKYLLFLSKLKIPKEDIY
ncbi:MAG TPA: hypothetical protein VK484_07555 [Ferruginibacter sp.]|nr:hypothetical protein [Ferruginibacter sp.]